MDNENLFKLSRVIYSACRYLEVPMVSEATLRSCLTSPAVCEQHDLKAKLDLLATKVRSERFKAPHMQGTFWRRLSEVTADARAFLENGVQRVTFTDNPVVPHILNKGCKREDIRSILKVSDFQCPTPFWFGAPEMLKDSTTKIAEGGFAEIFLVTKDDDSERIYKIIPVGRDHPVDKDCDQVSFSDTLAEIFTWLELEKLNVGTTHRCPTFPYVHKISVIQDKFPESAVRAWDQFLHENSVDLPKPDTYYDDQPFIAIETDNGGENLDAYQMSDPLEAYSLLLQVAMALAIAEDALSFEHRDLHCGNVLVRCCSQESFAFRLRGKVYEIPSFGVQATIIDFTFSRITTDRGVRYLNLQDFLESSGSENAKFYMDHHYVYDRMIELTQNDWSGYYPVTNILWLKHVISVLLHSLQVNKLRQGYNLERKRALLLLQVFNESCLLCNSVLTFVRNHILMSPTEQGLAEN